jgi:hypothetical protein
MSFEHNFTAAIFINAIVVGEGLSGKIIY